MPINLFVILATNDKNISELEIESMVRNAKLVEEYYEEIKNGKQKDMGRDRYALVFEAFVLKYLPRVKTEQCFMERTGFESYKTFNKFLKGKYKNIAKLDSDIIIKVCLGLLLTKEECYDFFYECGQSLYDKDDDCIEKIILDILEIPRERVKDLTEKEKWNFAGKLVLEADKIYKENGKRGTYMNCKRKALEAREIYEES